MTTTTKASEKLAAMKARLGGKAQHIEPSFAEKPSFQAVRWFDTVRGNPTKDVVRQAADYFTEAVEDGKFYIVPVGNLETLLQQHPGIQFFYQTILVDAQQIRRWLEERLDRLESERYNHYMYSEEAKREYGVLKTTDASKLAKSDPLVADMGDCIRLMAYHEHNLEALIGAFENIKYTLNHIVSIRKEKLEEVWVDPRVETKNK